MYSRGYAEETVQEAQCAPTVKIPPGYDGSAIFEQRDKTERTEECCGTRGRAEPTRPPSTDHREGRGFLGDVLSRLPFKSLGESGGFLSRIGSEEILLIALALFLLFSESGDRECAVMLILLLFIA